MSSFKKSSFVMALMVAVVQPKRLPLKYMVRLIPVCSIRMSQGILKIIMEKPTKVRTTGVWPVERIRPV